MAQQRLNFKVELTVEINDMKNALKERGIIPNKANINRMIKMIQCGRFSAGEKFLEGQPKEIENLALYGFTFKK